jgi:hypothetical protein
MHIAARQSFCPRFADYYSKANNEKLKNLLAASLCRSLSDKWPTNPSAMSN